MSGGGGGPIIINKLLEDPTPIKLEDSLILRAIADRSVVKCSSRDALIVLGILWKYLRKT